MTSIATRNSVMAVKIETTEAVPAPPTSGADFVALQSDFSLSPGLESLKNEELRASLAPSQPVQGLENPSSSFSHYLRASGVIGQAPDYGKFIQAALGAVSTAGAEYDTAASSTTSLLKVGSGEADSFERGEAVLIKDPINGYRIRCLDAASGTDLTLGFAVPVAPGTGVLLGQAVLYKPANADHPSLSLWHYLGNGGATQMMAGARVVGMDIDVKAGELINAKFDLEGVKFYYNPIEITAATKFLDWTDDSGTFAAQLAEGTYANPNALAAAIQKALDDSLSAQTYTVTYNNTNGKFSIVGTGTLLSLLWNTGTNAANTIATKIGFSAGANSTGTGATTGYASATAVAYGAAYTPSYDSEGPIAAKNHEVMIGGTTDYACFRASEFTMSVKTPKANINDLCAETGVSGSIITSRETTVKLVALLNKFDAKPFYNFQTNQSVKFQYSFGTKIGGNWIAGRCGALYNPTMTITNIEITDQDGLARVSMDMDAYVNSNGQGETYINFV